MAFKDIWRPRVDGVDDADSSAVNEIAEAVIDNEDAIKKNANNISKKQDELTDKQLQNIEDVSFKQNALSEEQLKNIQDVPNKADTEYVNKTFTNILKGSAIGQSVNLTDVSPIEHNLDVKVKSKNISVVTRYANATGTNNLLVECVTIPMEVGKVYTASWDTKVSDVRCWFTLYQSYRESISQSKNINACDGTRKYYTFKIISKPGGLGGWALQQSNSAIAEECPISNFMLEEGEVATGYTPYMADVSGVSVKKCGKNLIPYPYDNTTLTRKGITFTDNGDGSITVNGTATGNSAFIFNSKWELADGATYIFSVKNNPIAARGYFTYLDETNTTQFIKADVPFVWKKEYTPRSIYIEYKSGDVINNAKLCPQLEVGSVATEYEPYIEPVIYTPGADGTVEGVSAIYPNTTLIASTGAVIDCEYNRDINKAFAELEQKLTNAVISLGGNV